MTLSTYLYIFYIFI